MPIADINGQRINYEIAGDGVPVVFITGFGSNLSYWNVLVPMISDRYKVITMDNRGMGRTEYKGKFTVGDMADDVIALMDRLSVFRAHVVGWSMGGCMAQEIALRHPERIISLTLISAYMRRPARSSYAMHAAIEAVREGARMGSLSMMLQVMCFPESFFLKREEKGTKENKQYSATIEGISDQMHAVDIYDSRDRISGIKVPTLCIHGTEDIMVPPEEGDRIVSLIKGCISYRIHGAGHIINPNAYLKVMTEHFRENE